MPQALAQELACDVKAPPFGEWRARQRPLRQEPEWTLNDQDVAEAWRQINQAALDECAPAAMLDLAADVVSTMGRWLASLPPGFCAAARTAQPFAFAFAAFVWAWAFGRFFFVSLGTSSGCVVATNDSSAP